MKALTNLERLSRPYSLLLDPQESRAAAYTNNHRLITETASQTLIAYAQAHQANAAPFDAALHNDGTPDWRPLPAWATPEVQGRLVLIWINRPTGDDPDEAWLAIPAR